MAGQVDSYSDDAPRSDPAEDALGMAPFAQRMAELIVALDAPNGYVIGLSGEWGSGKSSAIRFIKHYLGQIAPEKNGEIPAITVVDFLPWLVSGHTDLIGEFFKILSKELGHERPWWKALGAGAAKIGAKASSAISKVGWLSAHADMGALAAAGTISDIGLSKVAEKWADQPSLQQAHGELVEILRLYPSKILVVIDDLDRLQPEEIRAMMMMVKTVGQLPHVVYLLSYDRNVVWPALQKAASAAARVNFADKLVQQEIALPNPGFSRLVAQFLAQVSFLDLDTTADRWKALAEVALRGWLKTPRDVVRLVNNMRFAWPVLRDHMEPVEYLAIEGVRTFDKTLFDWLRDNAFHLFGGSRQFYNPDEEHDLAQVFKNALVAQERDRTVALACHFFPSWRPYFDFASADEAKQDKRTRFYPTAANVRDQRGIGDARIYDAYFGFYAPGEVVGRAALATFFAGATDEEQTYQSLKRGLGTLVHDGWEWTSPLFEAVSARIDSDAQSASAPLMRAALRIYGEFAGDIEGKEAFKRGSVAWRLFLKVAQHLPFDQVRPALMDAEEKIPLYALTLIAEGVRRYTLPFAVTSEDREHLLASVRKRIQRAADEERLRELPSLHAALMVWPEGVDDVSVSQNWLARHVDQLWLLPQLRIFLDEYAPKQDHDMSRRHLGKVIPMFLDVDSLKSMIDRYLVEGREEYHRFYGTILQAIEEYRASRPAT